MILTVNIKVVPPIKDPFIRVGIVDKICTSTNYIGMFYSEESIDFTKIIPYTAIIYLSRQIAKQRIIIIK